MAVEYFTPYGRKAKRAFYEGLHTSLKSERSSFDTHWRDIADFMFPRRPRWIASDRNKGDRRNHKIINNTSKFALRTLASGMHAGLTSPARPWFKLGTPDPDLAEFGAVKEWLHVLTQRMQTLFATTNLYTALPTVYGDMGTFGTAAMALLADEPEFMRAYVYPLGSYCLQNDARGLVTTFTREYEISVLQAIEEFGGERGQPLAPGAVIDWSRFSRYVKDLWDKGQYEAPVPVLWVVAPNREYTGKLGRGLFRWTSCHFERQSGHGDEAKTLRESGYQSFPIFAPRWETTDGDAYGTGSCGMDALGDTKQLQKQEQKKGIAVEKMVDPSLVGPTALRTQKTSLLPGAVTYSDTPDGRAGLRAIHEVALNLEHLAFDMERVENRITRAFYADLFLMLSLGTPARRAGQPVTAREIEERHEEKLLALGPVLEQTNDELLNRLIDRTYTLMDAAGLVPEPPAELDGVQLKVEYVSMLAEAQKLVGVGAQDRFLGTVSGMLEIWPEAKRKLNAFRIIDNYVDMLGVDPRVVVPDEEAAALVAADAQAQQALVAAQVAKDTAGAGKALSETRMDSDSALTRMTSQVA